MSIKKITAIIDEMQLSAVEAALELHGVTGFTVQAVRGRGSYFNAYSSSHLLQHIQVEVYTSDKYAEKIAHLIMHTADLGTESEGILGILPVEQLFWVNKQVSVSEDEFNFYDEPINR